MKEPFSALVVDKTADGEVHAAVGEQTLADLPEGSVTIRVAYSGVNFKDALACSADGHIVKTYPFVPGIDLSGIVAASDDSRFTPGQLVLVTGYELGVSHFGGLSEYARVPGDWIVPLPEGLSLRDAMAFGTAGLTAAMAVERLERHGLRPGDGPVLVTGASGGVGSLAIAMLAQLGCEVVAASGKPELSDALRRLGAASVVSRDDWRPERPRALDKQRWAGVVDVCGGGILAAAVASTKYGGAVAATGMTAGGDWPASVFPFILRGITLYGIDSVYARHELRLKLWSRMASAWRDAVRFDGWVRELRLEDVPHYARMMREGGISGRAIVRLSGDEE